MTMHGEDGKLGAGEDCWKILDHLAEDQGSKYAGILEHPTPEEQETAHALEELGAVELLNHDDRPSFVLNRNGQTYDDQSPLRPAFINAALRSSPAFNDIDSTLASPGLSQTESSTLRDFKSWIGAQIRKATAPDITFEYFVFAGLFWLSVPLKSRFQVIRGQEEVPKPPVLSHDQSNPASRRPEERLSQDEMYRATLNGEIGRDSKQSAGQEAREAHPAANKIPIRLGTSMDESTNGTPRLSSSSTKTSKHFDWTSLTLSPSTPSHIRFARSVDWASTALGPIENWPSDLRFMCNFIMANPHPAAMYWSEDLIAIYNEAYVLLAGSKHPQLMGQSYRTAWAEIWENVKDAFDQAFESGQATMKDDDCLFIARSAEGNLEETYFSWSIVPLVGSQGSIVGLYNPAFENTRRKVAERRMFTLREVGDQTARAQDQHTFWSAVLKGLNKNEYDAPFAILYTARPCSHNGVSAPAKDRIPNRKLFFEGSIGVPEGHPSVPPTVDLHDEESFLAKVFRESEENEQPTKLSLKEGTTDMNSFEGLEPRGFGDSCTAAVVVKVHVPSEEGVMAFLIMGCNPRRPYDNDYNLFVQLLSRQLATSLATVVLLEEEIDRGREAAERAAREQIELSEQLRASERQAVESETKFTRMSQLNPVGLFIADSDGKIIYCNEKWYEISRVPRSALGFDEWMDVVKDEDKQRFLQGWKDLVEDAAPLDMEIRFKTIWRDQKGNEGDTWVLAMAHPEKDNEGQLKMIFGSITDISPQKWAEHLEKRRTEEAVKLKRQQENFIDITSHEMRNPLSAMLQCADEIQSTLANLNADKTSKEQMMRVISNAVETSNTIILCAQHQKRIVDDILTLSKLDSALLLVTPCPTEPKTVIQRALRIFDNELQSHDIDMVFKIDDSFEKLDIRWVTMDPSRVLQVLINLITNSIKFTSTQSKRVITVTLGATLQRPTNRGALKFVPTRSEQKDLTESEDEWGTGQPVYVQFSVGDTGRGLGPGEQRMLFQRFSQTSPRTHVQYGGSGLGLFISRELVELQGGEIGVASDSGVGSTFAFYIKCRKCTPSPEGAEQYAAYSERKTASKNVAQQSRNTDGLSTEEPLRRPPVAGETVPLFRILVVEDNVVNQKVLVRQLRNAGCTVHSANHGGECLEILRNSKLWSGTNQNEAVEIDVILMDQEMPVMDGLTCTKEIRRLEKQGTIKSHIPIIAVTANARKEQIETVMEVGMDDVVAKPFRIPDLLPKMRELLERYPMPR